MKKPIELLPKYIGEARHHSAVTLLRWRHPAPAIPLAERAPTSASGQCRLRFRLPLDTWLDSDALLKSVATAWACCPTVEPWQRRAWPRATWTNRRVRCWCWCRAEEGDRKDEERRSRKASSL